MRDKDSGKSRGFGFVFFDDVESVHRVPSVVVIEGRKVQNLKFSECARAHLKKTET